jgi:predicted nucleotidyltransferase component of viral defense system
LITKTQLTELAKKTDLNLYQQEKDYLLKLFLHNYYRRFEDAVFKGGSCIRYLHGLNRFSEDLDFNVKNTPRKFGRQVEKTLKDIQLLGIENHFMKKEEFPEAYTCEIAFKGPLHTGSKPTRNKFRIDAGKRTGTIREPIWQLIPSEYPETPPNFMVLALDEEEMLAEKILALADRGKGRDLYDVWFLVKKGVKANPKILASKTGGRKVDLTLEHPTEIEYERDMKRLTNRLIPYRQVKKEVEEAIFIPPRDI